MSEDPTMTGEERERLAADYALGLLEGDELALAERLAANDADFRRDAGRWSGRLAPLFDEVEEARPPASAWAAIERRTGGNVVQLKRRLTLWQGYSAAATALAASLALVLIAQPSTVSSIAPPSATPAPMVAMLGEGEGAAKLVATWDPGNRRLVIAAAADMPADPGREHELWLIPADGKPRPMGMMKTGKMYMVIPADMAKMIRHGATLAISVEPMGGSKTGLPTGPVIAAGKLEQA